MLNNHLDNLEKFCRHYRYIYLYGAGNVGAMVADYLNKKGIGYDGFCVTSGADGRQFHDHDVINYHDIDIVKNEVGFIVTLSRDNAESIVAALAESNQNFYYSKECLFAMFEQKCKDISKKVIVRSNKIEKINQYSFKQDTMYICCPASIGDTLYIAALSDTYKKEKRINRVCLIVKQNHESMVSMFGGVDEYIVSDEMVDILDKYSMYRQVWNLDNYVYGHFHKDIHFRYYEEYFEFEKPDIRQRYSKLILGLHGDSPFEIPGFDRQYELFKSPFFVLMPYAQTAKMLPDDFWSRIAENLLENGYKVYTNVDGKKEVPIIGTKAISCSLIETAKICEKAKAVIALRSGICDLLAFTDTKLIVLNTSEELYEEWNLLDVFNDKDITNVNCYEDQNFEDDLLNMLSGLTGSICDD